MKRVIYPALIAAGIIIVIIFSSNIFFQLNQHHVKMQISKDEAITYRLKEHIVERFSKAQLDTVFIASFMSERIKNYSADPTAQTEGVKADLRSVVPSLFRVNSIFSGLSYINRKGAEAITMDSNGLLNKPLLTEDIKNSCYNETSKHRAGEVYTTFDNTAIYICSPVYDYSARFSGVVVMAVNNKEVLKELQPVLNDEDIILMEDTGKYILSSSSHSGKQNFLDEYPQSLYSKILSSQSGNLEYGNSTLVTYTPVDLDDRQWFLILSTDKDSAFAEFSALYERLVALLVLAAAAIIAALVFWLASVKKEQIARQERLQNEQLEAINNQLQEKQYTLEEQNTIIEELNSQLEDENARYLQQKKQLEALNRDLFEKQYDLEEQNTIIEELNSQLEDENVRYHQQKEILQAIIDSLGAGIMMVDMEGKVMFINKAWKDIYYYMNLGEDFERYNDFYISNDIYHNAEMFIRKMMMGIENSGESADRLIGLIKDGKDRYTTDLEQTTPMRRFLNLYSNPCVSRTNRNFGRVFVVRDVSHQKEVDRLKLELISTVSHELRTPMSSILGFSELMLTRKLSGERNKEYISIINSEARRLTDLINDFLDIQRMESGKQFFNKKLISIGQVIKEGLKLFYKSSDKHNIIFKNEAENSPDVYCDRDKILQVLSNLLSNAIKYSPDGGDIKVSLAANHGKVRVSVTDYGLGIPEEVRDKLFTKFFRVDNDDRRKIGGTGLGLAICKEIIQAHRGDIGVESQYGQGSTFYFELPYPEIGSSGKLEVKADNNLSSNERGSLLIVEDDTSMVKLIKEILKDEGLKIDDVSSGEEALKVVAEGCYKLIILDIALNGQLNGWDVLKELKANQSTANIPIIISSAYENKSTISQNDVADYLVKPFESEHLIKMVYKAINGKLESKMMINSDDRLKEVIVNMLSSRGISVHKVEYSGNILIITLEGEGGLKHE